MAPLVVALKAQTQLEVTLCVTGQHRHMLDQVLALFDLKPDFDLDIMKDGQDLTDVTTAVLTGLRDLFIKYKPDRIFVHGDTNTSFSASLAAFYSGVAVSHVEAGLRTGNIYSPWPEEANRRLTSIIADKHYAPTQQSKDNLLAENVSEDAIRVTGNTVIDALQLIAGRLDKDTQFRDQLESEFSMLDSTKRLILVTGHRRENFGGGFEGICTALAHLSQRDDVQIIYPVHLNPNVSEPVNRILGSMDNIHLLKPLEYLPFVFLMSRCYLIISDPVLVMRDTTERPEAVAAGTVRLVGTDSTAIVSAAAELLDNADAYKKMSIAANPYGTGDACVKIIEDLIS